MKGWHLGALAAVLAGGAALAWGSTAAASPASSDELLVAADCSRIELKDKAKVVARVGAVVVRALPSDDTPVMDLLLQVARTLVPQCTWPPPAGLDPEFVSPDGTAKWSQISTIAAGMTWGQARKALGSFDMASPSADPATIAAGLAIVALLAGRTGYTGS